MGLEGLSHQSLILTLSDTKIGVGRRMIDVLSLKSDKFCSHMDNGNNAHQHVSSSILHFIWMLVNDRIILMSNCDSFMSCSAMKNIIQSLWSGLMVPLVNHLKGEQT